MNRVFVVSELYHPEDSATGYYVTRIAEDLARAFPVRVFCGQPSYEARGTRAPRTEERNGVSIRRCASTRFDRRRLFLRVVNLATLSLSVGLHLLRSVCRGDVVLAVTNPPSLPVVASLVCRLRGARFVFLIHDVYPEALVAAGLLGRDSLAARALARVTRAATETASRVIVLGRDAQALVARKCPKAALRLVRIPNWADLDEIGVRDRATNGLLHELGLLERFVVQYAGNLGATHDIPSLLEAAWLLREDPAVRFLFVGGGARRRRAEAWLAGHPQAPVTFLPRQPRSRLAELLSACDLAVIAFVPGMSGVSVPSRVYNVLAAGKPILAAADASSEPARLIEEEAVGWVVEPGDVPGIAAAVRRAAADRPLLAEMGRRARLVAETQYGRDQIAERYRAVVGELLAGPATGSAN